MNKKNQDIEYVTLPYDFVPFAGTGKTEDYLYPYREDAAPNTDKAVPKHNDRTDLSGCITYTIRPYSELALEMREKDGGGTFLSGSSIRGKIRSNIELLSASYPKFIDRSEMLYRNIASKIYRGKVLEGDKVKSDIEKSIKAGYLQKRGNAFYVVPAKKIGDKYFASIKEHQLLNMNLKSDDISYLFEPGGVDGDQLLENQKEIKELNGTIKSLRRKLKEQLKKKQKNLDRIFMRKFSFLGEEWESENEDQLNLLEEDLQNRLMKEFQSEESENTDIIRLCKSYARRWRLKAEIEAKYRSGRKVEDFKPYQQAVFLKSTHGGSVVNLVSSATVECTEKACLFNSTNATSKRSHYIVKEPDASEEECLVPQSVIESYNMMYKKMQIFGGKSFYDLFGGYDKLYTKESKTGNLAKWPIVFFKDDGDSGEKKVLQIGRTPYFKVPYGYQLTELLGTKEIKNVDYASALFGYVKEEKDNDKKSSSYKSRLRFSPVDVVGNPKVLTKQFLLPSPFASASAMYLQQNDKKELQSYEKKEEKHKAKTPPKLNGYKYYHVLKETILKRGSITNKEMISERTIIKPEGVSLKGTIYFTNLKQEEVGLLLLGLNSGLLFQSQQYKEELRKHTQHLEQGYELIGGAKPYGYGKVKFESLQLKLDIEGNDFESLIADTEEESELGEYIDAFITKMGGKNYFEHIHLNQYLQSKQEKPTNEHKNWTEDFGGGYKKHWRLKSN
ncbi:hypothetical protein [Sporosarcina limicola]|uniref:CRISPR-associated protein (TIGR03986 family) n=1 Tax=Sporosarcina limicola TaxID=34101 RepID=A0A927MQ00_9BACL|nr:hypothetical protein [Sporosarcina limicola]MBE1555399.1 CRISPR-associated protein (TIGR03986 family) [Sporosarcina limicola]